MAKVAIGRQGYYLATVASGREHAGGLIEPDGVWLGTASSSLGLSGPVTRHDLDALLEGVDPRTGEILRTSKVHVAALDCVFSPPKSVSILHALGPAGAAEELRAGHQVAVAGAVGYLERRGGRVRRATATGRRSLPADGLAAAAFLHRTSRAPDPHLHTHVLVANSARGPDGRWSALDGRALFLHASTTAHLYEAQVRREVAQRLGLRWRPLAGSWSDLEGFDAEVLRAFSRRSAAIERRLAELGLEGPHARRIAALATRPPKVLTVPYEDLVSTWRAQATSLGVASGRFDRLVAAGALHIHAPPGSAPAAPGAAPAELATPAGATTPEEARFVTTALSGLTARAASFSRRDLIRARCRALPAGAPIGEIEKFVDRILSSPVVAARGSAAESLRRIPAGFSEQRWTTPEIAALERSVVAAVERGSPPVTVMCATGWNRYEALEAARAHRLGVAPTRGAARSLEALSGFESMPVASLSGARLDRGTVLVVADAERLDPRSLAGVMSSAAAARASVVLVAGDRARWRDAVALQGIADIVGTSAVRESARSDAGAQEVAVDAMNVVFAASCCGLRERVLADWQARRERGERAVVVVSDRRLAEELGADGVAAALPSHDLVRAADRLLVLGDASSLPPAVRRSTEARRDHYVVDRLGAPQREAAALEIALPARIERELGPRLDDPEARFAWRRAASAHKSRASLREALRDLSALSPEPLGRPGHADGRGLSPR